MSVIAMEPIEDWRFHFAAFPAQTIDTKLTSLMPVRGGEVPARINAEEDWVTYWPISGTDYTRGSHYDPFVTEAIGGHTSEISSGRINSGTGYLCGLEIWLSLLASGTFADDTEFKYYPTWDGELGNAPEVASAVGWSKTLETTGLSSFHGYYRLEPEEFLWGGFFTLEALGSSPTAQITSFLTRRLKATAIG